MKNEIYTQAIQAYKTGIITVQELYDYLYEYGLESVLESAYMAA